MQTHVQRPTSTDSPLLQNSVIAQSFGSAVEEQRPTAKPPTSVALAPQQSPLKRQVADVQNMNWFGQNIRNLAAKLGDDATPQAISTGLATTTTQIHPDSYYLSVAGAAVTLAAFCKSMGFGLPTASWQLRALADAVEDRARQHPLGNLGGALAWSNPLTTDEQRQLRQIAMNYEHTQGDKPQVMQTKGGVLEFLRYQNPLPRQATDSPVKMLEALLGSPEAQLMGEALQERMKGIATDSSATDYLLAAIALQMDPESITEPRRNRVAGLDLDGAQFWGKPASAIVDGLVRHLSATGKTSPDLAPAAAHLLLASQCPALLIKDIPASVTYGSPAWVHLAVAAATIEARTPGKVPNMTFAQVMLAAESAGREDPAVTQAAQRGALIDWGVANGVLPKKDIASYSADELQTLLQTFKARTSEMLAASTSFDSEIPSRREMALAVLKKRFPDKEGMFEEKLIHVSVKDNSNGQSGHRTVKVGPHSLLDVAMMDLDIPDLVFNSKDSRVPLKALNENQRFGVKDAFESQFNAVIAEKKQGVSTYIKHLVSQLPLEDRKNFEYGKLTFFQKHSHTMGVGFTDKHHHPKAQELLVKIERDGKTAAYEINFNAGQIKSIAQWMAAPRSSTNANHVSETKVFTPTSGQDQLAQPQASAGKPAHDSFTSSRTQLIADAFLEHINLDDPAIKQQARGITTADQNSMRADAVLEFMLNLVPFRSAIVNFRGGNVGEGLLDLGLDLFGFLTAGMSTLGKVTKIASTAANLATKTARAAKVIGMTTFNTLNPLAGAGDLAVGSAKLIGKGVDKAAGWVNTLRGASGHYDLLAAAGKSYDAAAIGTFRGVGQTTQTPAVLKEGQWYNYDVDASKAYGSPIKDFTPSVVAAGGEIKALNQVEAADWLTSWFRSPAPERNYVQDFERSRAAAYNTDEAGFIRGYESTTPPSISGYSAGLSVNQLKQLSVQESRSAEEIGKLARRIEYLEELPNTFFTKVKNVKTLDTANFDSGYKSVKPESISGYSSTMKISELQELALQRGRSTAEIACLSRQVELKTVALNLALSRKFSDEIRAAGGTLTPMPQGFYLSQVEPISGGQCAMLANSMAYAIQEGREATLIDNFFTAMAHPNHPDTQSFRNKLQGYQANLRTNFHVNEAVRNLDYKHIIDELAEATTSKSLLIGNTTHGISAGVRINGVEKEWFYYDPNLGLAKFNTEAAMRNGLERAFNSGATSQLFAPPPGTTTYSVSTFNEVALMTALGDIRGPYSLFATPITISTPIA
jgi:hypothetical protein